MKINDMFSSWRQDLPASVVVFLVALPLCLGIALASGAPPITGLIAGVIGGVLVGSTSGSQLGVSGPAAGLAALVAAAIKDLGSYETFLLAVVLAGAIQVLLGVMRAGVIAYFFPNSVIKGMLSGIGIIIILKQIPHALGYDADFEGDESFQQIDSETTFSAIGHVVNMVTPGAILVTVVCLAILIVWESARVKRSHLLSLVPGPLLAVIAGIVLGGMQGGFGKHALEAEHYVDLPDLSAGLAVLTLPDLSAIGNPAVWVTALTIALVASIETLLSVEATDRLDPQKRITPTNRELRAQGAGNIVSGLIGGLPITQVIVRSSANMQSGARTRLSAVVHGILLLLSILLIPGVLELIPLASLAAVLFTVGYKLAKPSLFHTMWARGWEQFLPFIVTVLGVVFIDLLKGVSLGMVVGIFIVLRNSYLTPFHFQGQGAKDQPLRITLSEEVTFFNKASIQRTLAGLPPGSHVIIDGSRTKNLDPDVHEIIEEMRVRAKEQGTTIELVSLEEQPKLATSELTENVLKAASRKSDGAPTHAGTTTDHGS